MAVSGLPKASWMPKKRKRRKNDMVGYMKRYDAGSIRLKALA